jgi:serine/threonine-protein kinase RsbT
MAVAMIAGRNPQDAVTGSVLARACTPGEGAGIGATAGPSRPQEVRVPIVSDSDVVAARRTGRVLSMHVGFSSADATIVATAISELARNIVLYAARGEIVMSLVRQQARIGLTVVARDDGPGIPDIRQAMQDGYSSGGRLGVGLPGVKRLMDDFQIFSTIGHGTTVTVTKWREAA